MLQSVFIEILLRWLEFAPVVVGLVLTTSEIRNVREAQRLNNHLQITQHHREIWSSLLDRPELGRILQVKVDLTDKPISNEESLFVTFLILHLKTSFRASRAKMLVPSKSLEKDMRWFFSLPIPSRVWKQSREFQDEDFARFIENALRRE